MPRRFDDLSLRRRGEFSIVVPERSLSGDDAPLKLIAELKPTHTGEQGREWHKDAYLYARTVGEVKYALNLKANTVAACELEVLELDPETGEEKVSENIVVTQTMEAFVGPQGGVPELLRRAAFGLEVAGEAWLIGIPTTDDPRPGDSPALLWEFLSTQELRTGSFGVMRRDSSGQNNLGDDISGAYIARCHRSDPEFSDLPDCALRGVLSTCRQIVLLGQLIDAASKSRANGGLFFVPDSMSFSSQENRTPDELDIDELTDELIEHMAAPLEDNTSPSSLVPLVMRGPADDGAALRLVDIGRDVGDWALALLDKAIDRLATGLDMPREMLTGKGELNHWTGYSIDAEFVSKHCIPLGVAIAEFLTESYLRPMLVLWGGIPEADARRFRINFDASNITARADAGTTMLRLFDRGIVSAEATRNANGATEADAPDEEEERMALMTKILMSNPVVFAPVLLPLFPGFEGIDLSGLVPPEAPPLELEAGAPPPPVGDDDVATDDPQSGGGEPELPAAKVLERLVTAADVHLNVALERAGSRVVTRLGRIGALGAVADVPKRQIFSQLCAADFATMGETPEALLAGAWDNFKTEATAWLCAALPPPVREDQVQLAVMEMCESLTELAVGTGGMSLFENGLHVPDELVRRAIEVNCAVACRE